MYSIYIVNESGDGSLSCSFYLLIFRPLYMTSCIVVELLHAVILLIMRSMLRSISHIFTVGSRVRSCILQLPDKNPLDM